MQTIPQNKKPRIDVVDALRGFAIMGIMLLHSIEHFNFYVFPDINTQPDWLNSIDDGIWETLFFLFGGKGYAIFAILFGFTFSLMYTKQQNLGKDFGWRFLWRMLLLACFAFFNGLFFPGEVLLMYALVGIVLFIVRHCSAKALLIISILLLLQPIEWSKYICYLMDNSYEATPIKMGWDKISEGQFGESFLELIKSNTLYGHKAALVWSYNVGRLLQTAGLFIFGYWLGKNNLFTTSKRSFIFWKRVLIISSIAFVPLFILELNFKTLTDLKIYSNTIFKAIDMYGNLAFTLVLISSFIILYNTDFFRKLTNGLRYCGKMSLTAYIFQSIIGGFVFYGYGLGLGPLLRHTASFAVGVLLFTTQVYLYKLWLKKFNQGPLEKLWHKLTWLKF